jgi:hypothetical protein
MSDARQTCVYCYYNSYHGNAAKWFSNLWDKDYKTICVSYTAAMVILLRDSQPYDLDYWMLSAPLEAKMETYRHSTSSHFNFIFK